MHVDHQTCRHRLTLTTADVKPSVHSTRFSRDMDGASRGPSAATVSLLSIS